MQNLGEAVDMVATARAVQQTSDKWRLPNVVKLIAPAKVNLFLGIGAAREDGYHEATSVLHAITLHDMLYMRRASNAQLGIQAECQAESKSEPKAKSEPEFEANAVRTASTASTANNDTVAFAGPKNNVRVHIECIARESLPPLAVPTNENIVFRAIDSLARDLNYESADSLEIRLEKHIPHQAGLGGGSSDAAAALLGAARLWNVASDDPALERVARHLGSDVAFFLHGGCACFEGTGDRFDHTLDPMKQSMVIVKPNAGVSTAAAYRTLDENPQAIDNALLEKARNAACAADVVPFNNLAAASERLLPELKDIRIWMQSQPGVKEALLCGSGSATFAVVDGLDDACRLAAAAQAKGWWARSSSFASLRATVIPQ